MRDYLNIGSVPYEEDCAQVGSENYETQSRRECRAFKNQCERVLYNQFGNDVQIGVVIKSFPHDFGWYTEVCASYEEGNQEQLEQALFLESTDELAIWDDEANKELGLV